MKESIDELISTLPSALLKKPPIKQTQSHFSSLLINIFPKKIHTPISLDGTDATLLMFFMGLGLLTRIIRIQYPKNVVFNENIYGNITNNYLKGIFFDDANPPLPKLILAGAAYFAGYKGDYSFNEKESYNSMFYVMLRFIPAFFGSLCIPMAYLTMRIVGVDQFGSSVAAIMVSSDLILIIEARHFMSDGIVHCFSIFAIFSIFLYEKIETFSTLLFEGLCLGLAAASKHTTGGIVLLGFIRQFPLQILIESNFQRFFKKSGSSFVRCFILFIIIILIQFFVYYIHLTILPYNTYAPPDLPSSIASSLVSETEPNWPKRSNCSSMLIRILSLIRYNHKMNMGVGYSSSYASPWWSWPLCFGKWVEIWEEGDQKLACLGNVFVWIPSFCGILITLFYLLITLNISSNMSGMIIGYFLSYFPFMFIPRDLYIFHYIIPLFFSIFNLSLIIHEFCGETTKGFIYLMLIHFSVIGYFLWCPFAYGMHVSDFNFLVWSKKWVSF